MQVLRIADVNGHCESGVRHPFDRPESQFDNPDTRAGLSSANHGKARIVRLPLG